MSLEWKRTDQRHFFFDLFQNSFLIDFDDQTNDDRQERQRRQANALPEVN